MNNFLEDPEKEYDKLLSSIATLKTILKGSANTSQNMPLIEKIQKLEKQKMQLEQVYSIKQNESNEELPESDTFPILSNIFTRFNKTEIAEKITDTEAKSLYIYLLHFDKEFLCFFNKKKMKLDVKYSIDRDGVYDQFTKLYRLFEDYAGENSRYQNDEYSKQMQNEFLQRIGKMKHSIFIQANTFFSQLYDFAEDLISDLGKDAILCLNGDEVLDFSGYTIKSFLNNLTVKNALIKLHEYSLEVVEYINIPDFN